MQKNVATQRAASLQLSQGYDAESMTRYALYGSA